MADHMKCQLCLRGYKTTHGNDDEMNCGYKESCESKEMPLLLVCGHTFCHCCLVNIYEKKCGIFCPTCGVQTQCLFEKSAKKLFLHPHICAVGYLSLKNVKSLDKLTVLMEGIGIQQRKILQRSSQHCCECMQHVATVNCVQCGVNVCDECFKNIHNYSRVLKRHQAIPVAKSATNLASLDCKKHHILTNYFCVNDKTLICQDCINQDHENHKLSPLNNHDDVIMKNLPENNKLVKSLINIVTSQSCVTHWIISLQEKLQEVAPTAKQSLKTVNVVMANLEKYICDIDEELSSIHTEAKLKASDLLLYFMEITGKLQSNYLMLMDDLEQLAYQQMHHLLTLRKTATSELKNLEQLCGDARLVINSTKESETYVVDPVKTLSMMKHAKECSCVLKKTLLTTSCDDGDKVASSIGQRFNLKINEEIERDLNYLISLKDNIQFKYVADKVDPLQLDELLEDNSADESNAHPSAAENLHQKGTEGDKLMVVKVPPAQNQELVFVTLVATPDDFYIQRHCDNAQLSMVESGLKVYSHRPTHENDILSCVRVGELCAACTSMRKWCRAKVIKIIKQIDELENDGVGSEIACHSKDEVEVFLIDYGKIVKTKVSCLRSIPQKFHCIPPLAIPCTLAEIHPISKQRIWNKQALQIFAKMVANRPVLMTTVKREGGRRFVDLHKPSPDEIDNDIPISVRDTLVFMNLARFVSECNLTQEIDKKRIHLREYFKPSAIPARSYVDVVLSHYHSITRFFVQQMDSSTSYLENLTEKIQKFVNRKSSGGFDPTSPFSILKPFVNQPCLAKYECCDMWFRAKITKIHEDNKVDVFFVDYGNDAVISVEQLLKIPNEFMKLPYQGIECQLADVAPHSGNDNWSKDSLDRFFELVGEEEMRMFIKSCSDGVYSVELFDWMERDRVVDNQLSINERLVHEGLASGLTAHKVVEKIIQKPLLLPLVEQVSTIEAKNVSSSDGTMDVPIVPSSKSSSRQQVTVVYCKSPALFFTQNDSQWKASNNLTRELHKIMQENDKSNPKETNEVKWKEGDLCVLHSFQEKRWCRGKVIELLNQTSMCLVQLIDFGFMEKASLEALRILSSQFIDLSPHVTACFIADIQPAGGKKWTSTAKDLFKEMVWKKQCTLVTTDDSCLGMFPVKLFLHKTLDDDIEIGRELILRGVALPVFRLDNDATLSTSLSKIQQEFERSEAAYQQAENIHQRFTDKPMSHVDEAGGYDDGKGKLDKEKDNLRLVTFENEVLKKSNSFSDSLAPESILLGPTALEPIPPPNTNPLASEFVSANLLAFDSIPFPHSLVPGSLFTCVVTHIETHNTVYIKKLPMDNIFSGGTDFVSDIPRLKHFTPGTACLAQFDEDMRWYRAEVIGCDNRIVYILFVDYGLTQVIDDRNRLLILPDELVILPRQAIACSIPSMPSPVEAGLPEDQYLIMLANLIGKTKYLCSVLENSDDNQDFPHIELRVEADKTSLSELLAAALVTLDYESL